MKRLLVLLLFIIGCSTLSVQRESLITLPREQTSNYRKLIENKTNSVLTAKGIAKISATVSRQNILQRNIFLIERPNFLRLDFLPPNAAYALATLVAKEGQVSLADHREKVLRIGDDREVFQAETGIPTNPMLFSDLLLGLVPADILQQADFFSTDSGNLVIQANQYYWLFNSNFELIEFQLGASDDLELKINYKNFEKIAGFEIAKELEIVVPSKKAVINIEIQKIVLNSNINQVVDFSSYRQTDY